MLVQPDGRVAVLDWESAERGLPLWDLFYFMASFASLAGRARGLRRLDAFALHFAGNSPLATRFAAATAAYVRRVQVPAELVEPLFHTCWMHRALKESTRRRPDDLHRAHYGRILQLAIARRAAPGLQRLFAAGGAAAPDAAVGLGSTEVAPG
jgi:hypothetical protein